MKEKKSSLNPVKQLQEFISTRYQKFLRFKNIFAENARLRQSEKGLQKHLEVVVNTITGNHWWKDLEGRYQGFNDALTESLGLVSAKDIIGKTDYELPWAKNAEQLCAHDLLAIASGGPITRQEIVPVENGRTLYFMVTKAPLFDYSGKLIGTIGTSFDITEVKEAQQALEIAKEEAEAANEAKAAFLRNMRHDLRTPFSGILTLAQLMVEDETDPDKRQNLKYIAESADVLLDYMNKVLDQAQLGTRGQALVIAPIDLEKLLHDSLLTITPAASSRHLKLIQHFGSNVPQIVSSDIWRLQRIIINLLGNAVKFTHQGEISLGIDYVSETEEQVILTIWVKDTGIGIPKNKHDEIFQKFTRLEAAYSGKYPGTGLGLHDVKQICRKLSGDVKVVSNESRGSTFICKLPFTKIVESAVNVEIEPEAPPVNTTKIKCSEHDITVLLVEDQPIAAMTTARILRSCNYIVDMAETGVAALEKFTDKKYDVILMDIGLPDINGIEVANKMRQLETANRSVITPIIALTAHKDKDEADLKIFEAVFIKPFTPIGLREIAQYVRQIS